MFAQRKQVDNKNIKNASTHPTQILVAVSADGTLSSAHIARSSGSDEQDQAALTIAYQAKYRAATKKCSPIDSSGIMSFYVPAPGPKNANANANTLDATLLKDTQQSSGTHTLGTDSVQAMNDDLSAQLATIQSGQFANANERLFTQAAFNIVDGTPTFSYILNYPASQWQNADQPSIDKVTSALKTLSNLIYKRHNPDQSGATLSLFVLSSDGIEVFRTTWP